MSKIIYICFKNTPNTSEYSKLHDICKKLEPDNISATAADVKIDTSIAYGIMNPTSTILKKSNSVLLGKIWGNTDNWDIPTQDFPDGSFALFRDSKEHFEIVADYVGSRTIWYYKDNNRFIASTSQRAIILYLGGFEFNSRIIPWMLSTGSLGPDFSWDNRIKRLTGDSSVVLDKNNWTFSLKSNPVEFKTHKLGNKEHEANLNKALKHTFDNINLDYNKWVLPLSGGYDSRCILCSLKNTNVDISDLKTITWGLASSIEIEGNDAYVAKELAEKLNVTNKYYHTDISEESMEKIINRFILMGEGRIDHISGYMDGFKIWKTLFEDGIQGIIRGDEGFGWASVTSKLAVKNSIGIALCYDISNLNNYLDYGFEPQEFPDKLLRKKESETLAQWRDRLYHEYRIPTVLAALSDLKLSYTELMNPLLSRKILQNVRQMPDNLRTEKSLFKKIVHNMSPNVSYAKSGANARPKKILKQKEITDLIKRELNSNEAKSIFREDFINHVISNIKTESPEAMQQKPSFSLKSIAKKILPVYVKNLLMFSIGSKNIDPNVLAFRVFLIVKMNTILNEKLS